MAVYSRDREEGGAVFRGRGDFFGRFYRGRRASFPQGVEKFFLKLLDRLFIV